MASGHLDARRGRDGWDVIRYRESGCRLALDVYDSETPNGIECRAWKEDIVPYITESDDIDLVTTSASVNGIYLLRPNPPTVAEFSQGFLRVWEPWLESGKRLFVMSDGPSYGESVPACVERQITEPSPCAKPRDVVSFEDPLTRASELIDDQDFGYFDVIPVLCDEDLCHPVVGGLIAHKDGSHIAATFMVTMAPILASRFEDLVPGAFARSTTVTGSGEGLPFPRMTRAWDPECAARTGPHRRLSR